MVGELVTPTQLAGFPGAPFDQTTVSGVVGQVRDRAGWHIAPSEDETLTLDGPDTRQLVLPSLLITAIEEVRDVTNPDAPVVLTGWRLAKAGILVRDIGWPCGLSVIEVDLTHGYAACPDALLPLLGALAQSVTTNFVIGSERIGPYEADYSAPSEMTKAVDAAWSALDRYIVRTGF